MPVRRRVICALTHAADCGDYVVATNVRDLVVTGNKATMKKYIWHTGYPKGMREVVYKDMIERRPDTVLTFFTSRHLTHSGASKRGVRHAAEGQAAS